LCVFIPCFLPQNAFGAVGRAGPTRALAPATGASATQTPSWLDLGKRQAGRGGNMNGESDRGEERGGEWKEVEA